MTEILQHRGFLWTSANIYADATLVVMLAVALLFTVGAGLAHLHRYTAHRWVQTSAATLNLVMVAWMMVLPFKDFVLPALPEQAGERFYAVSTLHAVVGAVALPFGLFVVLRGNEVVPQAVKFTQ